MLRPPPPQTHLDAAARQSGQFILAIAATFTAEPLEETFQFWMHELELAGEVRFAPYNQVFQQLLDPASLLATNQCGLNILLLRWEDLGNSSAGHERERAARELLLILKTAISRGTVPWLACLCPASNSALANPSLAETIISLDKLFTAELVGLKNIHLVTPADLLNLYPVPQYDDPQASRLGQLPYTPACYSALATLIIRKTHALTRRPKKVIALDCDQTLWGGICGEDGPLGVELTPSHLALQKFMRAQHDAGMLLCLCSKNNDAEVAEVFRSRPEMQLRPEHFAARRVNWQAKSANLHSLAHELNLGLDSFVLLDDNPLECAEVEAHCPETLALQLPEDLAEWPRFLQHIWALDHWNVTSEDRGRNAMYQQNRLREQSQAAAPTLADFLDGLKLQIHIEPARPEQFSRVSQLTHRTNQFNCTTQRRSEEEILKLHRENPAHILTVTVRDRFGDYGLTGVITYQTSHDTLTVDTFLLSCRVLGKGVEHRMLACLGQIAQKIGVRNVEIPFLPTARNQPAFDFLNRISATACHGIGDNSPFRFPTDLAAAVVHNPEVPESPRTSAALPAPASTAILMDGDPPALRPARYRWIIRHARDPEQILKLVEARHPAPIPSPASAHIPPATETQRQLCDLWQQVLRLERVSIRDDFFELGGNSQLAVRLLARWEKLTGKKLQFVTIFKSPTIEQLARVADET
ncbi:HAD-IIIC family phosphatase [Pedosphaera parvula]|nr:HAD-IIIC family phosphatase [Pedosphaera parvula]